MLDIQGTHGFAMQGVPDLVGAEGPWQCLPCGPGIALPVNAVIGGTDFGGFVDFKGKRYPVGIQSDDAQILLFFDGPSLALPALSAKARVSGPFTVTADLTVPGADGLLFDTQVLGRGTLSVDLVQSPNDSPFWEFTRVDYAFNRATPVPEPGTLALVSSAIAGLAFRRRKRRAVLG